MTVPGLRLFLDRRFVAYTWIGVAISTLNIALLWLTIDVMHVPTLVASTVIIGGTFLLRYVLFSVFKVIGPVVTSD